MNQQLELSTTATSRNGPKLLVLSDRVQLCIIAVSGMLAISGTSSAEPARLWEGQNLSRSERTASSPGWHLFEKCISKRSNNSGEVTGHAISEIRLITGLTWEQLGQLFGVSRRSVHFWASGKPLNASNEGRLMQVLDILRDADRGDASRTRAALFRATDNATPFELLASERFAEARSLLGKEHKRGERIRTQLSPMTKTEREPMPPGELVDALHDPIQHGAGKGRAARTVRVSRRERA